MKELNSKELAAVNGGVVPLIVAVVCADLGLNAAFAAWYYAKTK
ncbi:class IIb bacteriocin, lactobin A/cerein 7B family [Shewanella dokdonensis]|uniref:Class IIb bacteriocin, lactobin A/cerein 7B family n=1 Tax=Shewanella dokdonensis TaxID=712036 RepID=A0ABX8DIK4_9GAMM|nr:class IIb bacteriocin, lactobin A/cerein 7B family [Shewanella dokdonensis]MCL1073997.1 class IIb bacteriocin, lactobin A/cerein 7B family [Shewanella dokdonensis]QVK23757.1 class IIb bacteriocin, lactobin A/cerein 7B family [Shewanella dokdonensis]